MSIEERNRIVEGLVKEYGDALRAYFYKRTSNMAEAEELRNELFFRLIYRMDRKAIENPQAFLFHAAHNLVADRHRRVQTKKRYDEERPDQNDDSIDVISPEDVLDSKQALQSLLGQFDGLDKRARDVFLLNRARGLKYAEIAQVYGISVSSVEKYIMKCLAHLAKVRKGKP